MNPRPSRSCCFYSGRLSIRSKTRQPSVQKRVVSQAQLRAGDFLAPARLAFGGELATLTARHVRHSSLVLSSVLSEARKRIYNFSSPDWSLAASDKPQSPSTSTHQPSPPLPPSPPTPALNSLFAYSNPSASKLPGCNHTAGIPASFACLRIVRVMEGGVMMESEVSPGRGRAEGDATVS